MGRKDTTYLKKHTRNLMNILRDNQMLTVTN